MAKKSTCSPNMTYVLCLVILGLIVYLLYSNYKESFYSEEVKKLLEEKVGEITKEKKEIDKELIKAKKELAKAKQKTLNESQSKTTRRYPKV